VSPGPAVETVRGAVAVQELGPTLMHEHVFVLSQETLQNFNLFWGEAWWDEEVRVADAIAKLQALHDAGVRTLVDATAIGLGRDIRRIQRINAEVDLDIVVCTGIYAFLELPSFFKYRSVESLTGFFVRELREGIDDSGVKAAFIKCAVEEHGIVGDVGMILAATAAAAVETGAPVMVHTNSAAQTGTLALDALTRAGVEPSRIVIAHAGDSNDLDYLRALADRGVSLGCDRFNIPAFNPDDRRIDTLVALLAEGYGDRIHLGHDAACFYDFMVGNPIFANERPDYLHISQKILPVLRERGVTEEEIDTMLIENPRAYFGQAVLRAPAVL
jgi:phosphotriesterase-related protein